MELFKRRNTRMLIILCSTVTLLLITIKLIPSSQSKKLIQSLTSKLPSKYSPWTKNDRYQSTPPNLAAKVTTSTQNPAPNKLTVGATLKPDETTMSHKRKQAKIHRLEGSIREVTLEISKAYQHARGSKTTYHLKKALRSLKTILSNMNIRIADVVRRPTFSLKSVCPEKMFHSRKRHPFFEEGFGSNTCTYEKPIHELVTVLLFFYKEKSEDDVKRVIDGVRKFNPKLKLYAGIFNKDTFTRVKPLFKSEDDVRVFDPMNTTGEVLNSLMNSVKTPYTFIARDMIWFNDDARLARLVREIERQGASAAGGATRNKAGYWGLGCHQSAFQNYTLVYKAGYDESVHDCIYCDYIDGPLMISTEVLKKTRFDDTLKQEGLFEDFFLRLNKHGESIICPDVMYFTEKKKVSPNMEPWLGFARKWELAKLRLSSGELLEFPIPSKLDCWNRKGVLCMSYWCQEELADSVEISLRECRKLNITCELDGGTLLGAVKMHTILPWERDADFIIPGDKFRKYESANVSLLENNHTLKASRYPKCCVHSRRDGGYFAVWGPHWRVEFLGQFALDSEKNPASFLLPTRVPLNGHWYYAPRNPGLHLRNRYGAGIYKHELHGNDYSRKGFKTFLPCTDYSQPNCLDRYRYDGNIQFSEPIP